MQVCAADSLVTMFSAASAAKLSNQAHVGRPAQTAMVVSALMEH